MVSVVLFTIVSTSMIMYFFFDANALTRTSQVSVVKFLAALLFQWRQLDGFLFWLLATLCHQAGPSRKESIKTI